MKEKPKVYVMRLNHLTFNKNKCSEEVKALQHIDTLHLFIIMF